MYPKNPSYFWFKDPEFLRDTKHEFKVAVIHRANFPCKSAEIVLLLRAGETGHAVDHELLPFGCLDTMLPSNDQHRKINETQWPETR